MDRYTIAQFNNQFPNDDVCLEWLRNYRWPDGIYCPTCGKITAHYKVSKRACYVCDMCGKHIYPMAGTIFEKSSTPLKYWFYAIFLMSQTRCGISAKQLQRELGVTYKTAWRMFHQIRSMLSDDTSLLTGEVEVDETYIGGKRPGDNKGRPAHGSHKIPVVGIVQRKGQVRAIRTKNVTSATIMPLVKQSVKPESTIYTDEYTVYNKLTENGYKHKKVNHAVKAWVIGDVHTNTIEGFWSLLKGGIKGVYKKVGPQYLQAYVDEYAFRYNHRKDQQPMFLTVLKQI